MHANLPGIALVVIAGMLAPNAALAGADRATVRTERHVAPGGDDDADGSATHPLKSLSRAIGRAQSGDTIVVHAGTYRIGAPIDLKVEDVEIRAAPGDSVVVEHCDASGRMFNVTAADVIIEGLTLDGRFISGSRAVKAGPDAARLAVRNCEIRNFTRHAVDVDGNECLIEKCHIHHILWWNNGERDDAHGIVTERASKLGIVDCNIHHVSGDCFQSGRGSWQDISIEGCRLWDGPLESPLAGFPSGVRAAENAIDTKLDRRQERGRLVVKRCRVYGFRSSYIGLPAAFNLKEHVDAVVDGCDITDSVVALRLRGTSRGAQMWPTIVNCTIHDCDVALRYEDGLSQLRFAHNTVARCQRLFARVPVRSKRGPGWLIANNLFLDVARLPDEAQGGASQAVSSKAFDQETLQPKAVDGLSGIVIKGVLPDWYGYDIETDHKGSPRSKQSPILGAFETPVANKSP